MKHIMTANPVGGWIVENIISARWDSKKKDVVFQVKFAGEQINREIVYGCFTTKRAKDVARPMKIAIHEERYDALLKAKFEKAEKKLALKKAAEKKAQLQKGE